MFGYMSVTKSKAEPPKKGKATELSQKVAEVLMALRQARQMSQRAFAEHIGVSFQQYQKYEKGRDRLSLEKAMLLCAELDLPLSVFMDDEATDESGASFGFAESEQQPFGAASAQKSGKSLDHHEKQVLEIFAQIPAESRNDFLETLRQLAKMTLKKS